MVLEATLGGIRRHVVDLLLGLDLERHRLTLVYSSGRADPAFWPALSELRSRGVRTVEVAMGREIHPLRDLRAAARLSMVLDRVRPDVIHLHGAKAGAIGRVAAVQCGYRTVIYNPHGGVFHKFSGRSGGAYLSIERLLNRVCHTEYIGVSRCSCEEIRSLLFARPENVHLVHNGVPPLTQPRGVHPNPYGTQASVVNILFPAVLLPAKGHLEFIRGLASSRSRLGAGIRIWLVGDGPLRQAIVDEIERSGFSSQILLAGFAKDLDAWYSYADLVILPSMGEAFGYAALEAMHHGKTVVAAKVGGLVDIITPGLTGFFLPEDCDGDLAGFLNDCVSDGEELEVIGRGAREFARSHFSLDAMVRGTEAVYRAVAGAQPEANPVQLV